MQRPSPALLVLIGTLAAATYLVGMIHNLVLLKLLVKAIPVLCMAVWVWQSGSRQVSWGLIFGAVGDICLNVPGGFIAGMLAFAIGHSLYVRAFIRWRNALQIELAIPVVLYLALPMSLMLDGTGPLTLPVLIYMLVIGAMLWRAAVVANDMDAPFVARWAALAGALLFAFSDTLIGLNRFAEPLPGAAYPIILSYWAGQWLIAVAGKQRT